MNYPINELLRLFLTFFLVVFITSLVMKKMDDKEDWKKVFHVKSIVTTTISALAATAAYILLGKLF